MTVIPLGRASPHGSSHLPADSVGHVNVCLFGVAPRRDWPFHSVAISIVTAEPPRYCNDIVTVPLILASRRTGVTRYAALWSPDFPLRDRSGAATAWLASHRHFTPAPGSLAHCFRQRNTCAGSSSLHLDAGVADRPGPLLRLG